MIKRPWRRFFAINIDLTIMLIIVLILQPVLGLGQVTYSNGVYYYNLYNFDLLLASWAYFIFFAIVLKGKTPGKLLLNIRVYSNDGSEMKYKNVIIREFVKVPLLIIGFVSFVSMHALASGETLHDLIMQSNVYITGDIRVRKIRKDEYKYNEITKEYESF